LEKAVGNLEPLDVAADLLRQSGAPMLARQLLVETVQALGGDPEDARQLAALQTDISLDNRFLPGQHGTWALKEWVPKPKAPRAAKSVAVHKQKQASEDEGDAEAAESTEEWD